MKSNHLGIEKHHFHTDSYLDPHYIEWAGLEKNIKKAAIFYIKKSDLSCFIDKTTKKNFFFDVSDFAFDDKTGKIMGSQEKILPDCLVSVYVSKDKDLCVKLKLLDRKQQLEKDLFGEIDKWDVFFEIGDLLGYPKCCSEFVQKVYSKKEFEEDARLLSGCLDDETLLPILTFKENTKKNSMLNNFSSLGPKLINFFVCGYNCKNALKLAEETYDYLKEKTGDSRKIFDSLKIPMIFFSSRKIVYFVGLEVIKEKIHYSGCFSRKEFIDQSEDLKKILGILDQGDSFLEKEDGLDVFKNDVKIAKIKKHHRYSGIYIDFVQ
ncbi:hypothetical protein ISS07_04245 [Candidatus Woesearchaeota archaeon]|nr:hypothetical protein [Candidatus Woesearchaeota archaeon]